MGTIFLLRLSSLLVLVFTLSSIRGGVAGAGQDDEYCGVKRCNENGPIIRFPFRLKDQPDHCGHPGFELSCWRHHTVLEYQRLANTSIKGLQLSYSIKAHVNSIDYKSQQINIRTDGDIDTLVSTFQVHPPTAAISPFKLAVANSPPFKLFNYTFFSCSSRISRGRSYGSDYERNYINSLSSQNFQVYAISSTLTTVEADVISCTKMYSTILPVRYGYYYAPEGSLAQLSWSTPVCMNCESKGEYCKLAANGTTSASTTTTCFPIPQPSDHVKTKRLVAGIIPSIFLLALFLAFLYYYIRLEKQKKEGQLKIEMFLEDYKSLKPTRYSYTDIKKITNQFKDELGQGGYGSVYKGQLSKDIFVAVKVLNNDSKGNGEEFINEVGTIGRIHHVNVVRLVGYCADGCNRALVYEFLPNKSLEKFVCSAKNKDNFLGWEKMQQIALGIAKGIEYLHQGCAQRILHFDIKPHNILLDQHFNPKISDFGLAKLCSKGESIVSMTAARGTMGYIAPEVFSRNFGKVSSKSDVYSFGMLLLEMVGGKNNNNIVEGAQNTSEVYFPEWIFHRLEQGGEVVIQIENEVDTKIARKLTIVGLWCIGWHPIDRPSMKRVIQMLQGDDCPAMPPNPFSSTSTTVTTHTKAFINELEVISESE